MGDNSSLLSQVSACLVSGGSERLFAGLFQGCLYSEELVSHSETKGKQAYSPL